MRRHATNLRMYTAHKADRKKGIDLKNYELETPSSSQKDTWWQTPTNPFGVTGKSAIFEELLVLVAVKRGSSEPLFLLEGLQKHVAIAEDS